MQLLDHTAEHLDAITAEAATEARNELTAALAHLRQAAPAAGAAIGRVEDAAWGLSCDVAAAAFVAGWELARDPAPLVFNTAKGA